MMQRISKLYLTFLRKKSYLFILFIFFSYSYCPEHTRKAQIARIKSMSKHSLPQTPEMLLLKLGHYVKPTTTTADSGTEDTDEETKSKSVDPFSKKFKTFQLLNLLNN